MISRSHFCRHALSLSAAAAVMQLAAQAQGEFIPQAVSRGQLSAAPVGLSLRQAVGPNQLDDSYTKSAGDRTTAPFRWVPTPNSARVNYGVDIIFRDEAANDDWAEYAEIDAWCTGNADIPGVNGDLDLELIGGRWVAVVMSVTNDTMPGPQAEEFISRRYASGTNRDRPGADLMTYYVNESAGLAAGVAGSTMMEQAQEHLRFAPNADVDAMDFGMGVVTFSSQTDPLGFMGVRDRIFFSISANSAALFNNNSVDFFEDANGVPVDADPGVIYQAQWVVINNQWQWTTPSVLLDRSDLGLTEDEDVDALAYDFGTGRCVFSTVLATTTQPSQLMLLYRDVAGQPLTTPLSSAGDGDIARRVGSTDTTRDVDAVSILDPEPGDHMVHFGAHTAVSPEPFATGAMGLGLARQDLFDANGDLNRLEVDLVVQLNGWGGAAAPGTGFVALQIAGGGARTIFNPGIPFSPINLPGGLGFQVRNPVDDVLEWRYRIPREDPIVAQTVFLRALYFDLGTGELFSSYIEVLHD